MSYRRVSTNEYPSYMYSRIPDDGFTREQFESPPKKVPYRAILFAGMLFLVGGILITVSSLYMSGHLVMSEDDTFWPMMVLGVLMFIPGVYTVRIALYTYLGYDGFSYDSIPEVQ